MVLYLRNLRQHNKTRRKATPRLYGVLWDWRFPHGDGMGAETGDVNRKPGESEHTKQLVPVKVRSEQSDGRHGP